MRIAVSSLYTNFWLEIDDSFVSGYRQFLNMNLFFLQTISNANVVILAIVYVLRLSKLFQFLFV